MDVRFVVENAKDITAFELQADCKSCLQSRFLIPFSLPILRSNRFCKLPAIYMAISQC